MKETFICENCNMQFADKNACVQHEEFCSAENIKIKAIVLNNKNKIEIFEYLLAKIKNDNIKIIENSIHSNWIKLNKSDLNHIIKTDYCDYIIYTQDFSKQFEETSIKLLIEEKLNMINTKFNILKTNMDELNNMLKNIN